MSDTHILASSAPADAGNDAAAGFAELDVLLSSADVSTLAPADADAARVKFLRSATAWHIERNERYARYCAGRGFDPAQLNEVADLSRVPLLPASLFKRGADVVSSIAADDSVLNTTSSGTQGSISVVPRDDHTLNRFFATLGIGTHEVLGQERADLRVFNLGPLDAGHLWIAYVMSGVTLFTDGRCYVRDDTFLLGDLVADLAEAAGSPITLVGPPPLILDAAAAVKEAGISLHPDSLVVTIGGWKRASGKMLPREEFVATVLDAYGLAHHSSVRDSFNMVELNTVLFECAEHSLHLPPWLYAEAKEPRTLAPMESGETGVLAFLDATPSSYPGFVLSDDFGSVLRNHSCGCGRTGDVLRLARRINRIEGRGCALKLDQRTTR